jgi:hypothetical protein
MFENEQVHIFALIQKFAASKQTSILYFTGAAQ